MGKLFFSGPLILIITMKTTSLSRDYNLPILFLFLLSILLFAGYRSCSKIGGVNRNSGEASHITPKTPGTGGGTDAGIVTLALSKAPGHVRKLMSYLKSVKHFNPPKGYKGGRVFRNREGILPKGKTYYEFDVHPFRPDVSRGAERLVVDQKKSVFYYTKDHYGTFVKIK